jgi:hypothetical protein
LTVIPYPIPPTRHAELGSASIVPQAHRHDR